MEKLFIVCTFDCSFQYYEETVRQWVKEQGEGIVIDYELVKINNHKSHSFYTVSSLEEFSGMLDSESVSYTHLRAHETGRNLVCRLLLEKKKGF